MLMLRPAFAVALIWLAVVATRTARADDEEAPIKITLHPAAVSQPALKHRLLPQVKDRMPGNAAVYYGKVKSEQNKLFGDRPLWEKIYAWTEMPIEELRREKPELNIDTPIYYLEQGAMCDSCDWQLPIRREPFYSILLPEIQEARSLARLLIVKARLAIAAGDFDAALEHLQTSYALARNVAHGETLINGLVGLAIAGVKATQIRDLVQQPGAPNLFWTLTELPDPLIDFRAGIEAEVGAIEMAIPELKDLESDDRTPEQWQATLQKLWKMVHAFSDKPEWQQSPAYLMAMAVKNYPAAKQGLIDRGMAAEAVERMSVAQVILIDALHLHHQVSDDVSPWFYVPWPQGKAGMSAAYQRADAIYTAQRETIPLSQLFMPGLQACRQAQVRTQRDHAALRVLEALRIYGAAHEGRLPELLSEIADLPVPHDPVTGEPFVYRREGDGAVLESLGLSASPLRYEIQMVRP